MVIAVASAHAPFSNPAAELRQEERVRHGHGKLASLHRLGAFVGSLELCVHPLISEEPGAIFGDAIAAHQADGFAHHLRAPARVPELCRRAKYVGQ